MSDRPRIVALVLLVALAPWPFGSTHWSTTAAIATIGLLASLVVGVGSLRRSGPGLSFPRTAAPLLALWLLGLLQVVPIPRAVLRLVAPGPSALWHPADPLARAVLGSGFRPISVYPDATLRWLAFAAGVLGLALVASPALRSRVVVLRSTVAVVAGALLVAIYGLIARLVFGDRLYGVFTVPTIAPFGPFVSKNHFAGYVEMAACLALGLAVGLADEARRSPDRLSWLDSRRAGWIVAAFGAAAVLALAVPVSLSRGGVVSLVAGLLTFAAIRLSTRVADGRPRTVAPHVSPALVRSPVLWTAGVLLVFAVGIAVVLPEEARTRVRTLGDMDLAGAYRVSAWRDSLRLVASSPVLGSGLGAFADALPRFKTAAGDMRIEHAENDYLELLAESGLVGTALAALAFAWGLSAAWRGLRDEPHRLSRGVRAGALAGLAALAVHSAVDFNLRIPSNALLAAFLLACVLAPPGREGAVAEDPAAGEPDGTARRHPEAVRRWSRYAFLAVAATAMVLALVSPWSERQLDTRSLRRAAPGTSPLRSDSLEASVASHLAHRPADASAWLALAWLRVPRLPADAAALASWALALDPLNAGLRRAAEPVIAAARGYSQPRRP